MPDSAVARAYRSAMEVIAAAEPDVAEAIAGELYSQRRQLKLIASENYASPAVLLAMGNWLSDKYAEGTPGHRLYAGCEMVDRVETLAVGPRQGPVRRRPRIRPAALWDRRQPGRLLGDPRISRRAPGARPRPA